MFIPIWLLVMILTLWIGIPLARFIHRKVFTDQPMSFYQYSEEGLRDFLMDRFSQSHPIGVQHFLNDHHIGFLYWIGPDVAADLENADSYINCSVPSRPPTKHPRYWLFYWEFQITFKFSEYELTDITVVRYSNGYDLVEW